MSIDLDLIASINRVMTDTNYSVSIGLDSCACKALLESSLYFYVPDDKKVQEKIKNLITEYAEQKGLKIVTSIHNYCEGDWECTGHYSDPFKPEYKEGKHVFIGKFPEDISGAWVHFLTPKNLKILKIIRVDIKVPE